MSNPIDDGRIWALGAAALIGTAVAVRGLVRGSDGSAGRIDEYNAFITGYEEGDILNLSRTTTLSDVWKDIGKTLDMGMLVDRVEVLGPHGNRQVQFARSGVHGFSERSPAKAVKLLKKLVSSENEPFFWQTSGWLIRLVQPTGASWDIQIMDYEWNDRGHRALSRPLDSFDPERSYKDPSHVLAFPDRR